MNQEQIENRYRERGLEVEHGRDEPGKVYEPHTHEQTFAYTLGGSIKVRIDNQEWRELRAGQEVEIGSNQLHEGVVGHEGWEYVVAWNAEEAKQYKDSKYSKFQPHE